MDRSLSFASNICYYGRPIQTRFRCAYVTPWFIMQKVRGHACRPCERYSASTACRLTVSGPISLPSPGYFSTFPHGTSSLSVTRECLAWARGRARFPQGFTCPVVLGYSRNQASSLLSTGLVTFFGGPFQALRLVIWFFTWRGHRTALP